MQPILMINVVGLTQELLPYMPRVAALGEEGFMATLQEVLPAVTTTAQTSILTGRLPREHGIVGNGWYFRELAEIGFWKQSNALIQGDRIWDEGRARFGSEFSVAKLFWWYNMYADVEWSVTPRPIYAADGRKLPSIYCDPPQLKSALEEELGPFPLFNFWGPGADIRSSRWIAKASRAVIRDHQPGLVLSYLPHLDYDLQRFGPNSPQAEVAAREIDEVAGDLIDFARGRGYEILLLSEYGIEAVEGAIYINRVLREAGFLRVQHLDTGWELLDAGASEAFAVVDHQIAHIYLKSPQRMKELKRLLSSLEGVDQVLDEEGKRKFGLDHPRSGELILLAQPDRWFAYHYWLDDALMPDFAPTVDIHRKPGYDPMELFVAPELRFPPLRIAWRLLQKRLGMRYSMDLISPNADLIRGSHGRFASSPSQGPLLLSSQKIGAADRISMTDLRELILESCAGIL